MSQLRTAVWTVTPPRSALIVLAVVAALLMGTVGIVESEAAVRPRILRTVQVNDRTVDLTVDSPALGAHTQVRLLLPPRYQARHRERWPVLYLLHGCCDNHLSWTRSTNVEELSAKSDVLVAMPDAGKAGFYSDWLVGPGWETFHTKELPWLLTRHYRANRRAAIAGNSMGGFGALSYAARHPGRYTAAASFSGIVHTRLTPATSQAYLGLVRSQGEEPTHLWGDPETDAETWAAHNPYDLASRLRGTRLFLSVGDGQAGPLDPPDPNAAAIESALRQENLALRDRLRQLRIPATTHFYSPGVHDWPYWQRELHRAWPLLIDSLHCDTHRPR